MLYFHSSQSVRVFYRNSFCSYPAAIKYIFPPTPLDIMAVFVAFHYSYIKTKKQKKKKESEIVYISRYYCVAAHRVPQSVMQKERQRRNSSCRPSLPYLDTKYVL